MRGGTGCYVRVTYGEVVILIHGVDLLAESDFLFA